MSPASPVRGVSWKRVLARVALVVVSLGLISIWQPVGSPRDPLERLAQSLSNSRETGEGLALALTHLRPEIWNARELGSPWPDVRRFAVRTSRRRPALAGIAAITRRGDLTLGWVTLAVGEDEESASSRSEALKARAEVLFEKRQGAARPLEPNPFEFLRRLQAASEGPSHKKWEIGRVSEGGALYVNSSPAQAALEAEGFSMIAARASGVEAAGLERLAQSVTAAVAEGSAIPTPRPRPQAAEWMQGFRSARELKTGETPLTEAVQRLEHDGAFVPAQAVSGTSARLVTLLDGPGRGEVSAIFEALPERVLMRTVIVGRESELLARLPRAETGTDASSSSAGEFVWSGRISAPAELAYAGTVFPLADFAFEWRPIGF